MSIQQEPLKEFNISEGMEAAFSLEQLIKNLWKYLTMFTPENRTPDLPLIPRWEAESMMAVIEKTHDIVKPEPLILDLQGSITVMGPLYGQGDSLITLLSMVGLPPDRHYLFLGNYMGQGFAPLETLMLVLALKAYYPTQVHLLRGNHEERQPLTELRLTAMLVDRGLAATEMQIFEGLERLFADLPLAARLPHRVLAMHGGPGPHLRRKGLGRLEAINKTNKESRTLSEATMMMEATWACLQPKDKQVRGNNMPTFNEEEVEEFLREHNIALLVRGRQLVEEGVLNYPKSVFTVLSAVAYLDLFNNCAAAVTFDDNKVMIHRYRMADVEAKTLDYAKLGIGRNAMS